MDYFNNLLLFALLIGQIGFLAFCFIKSNKFDTNRNLAEDALGRHIKKLSQEFEHFRVITMRKILSLEKNSGGTPSGDWNDWKDEVIEDKENKWGGGEVKTEDFENIVDILRSSEEKIPLTKKGKPDKRYKKKK